MHPDEVDPITYARQVSDILFRAMPTLRFERKEVVDPDVGALTPDDIKNMTLAEYASYREHLLGTASDLHELETRALPDDRVDTVMKLPYGHSMILNAYAQAHGIEREAALCRVVSKALEEWNASRE